MPPVPGGHPKSDALPMLLIESVLIRPTAKLQGSWEGTWPGDLSYHREGEKPLTHQLLGSTGTSTPISLPRTRV